MDTQVFSQPQVIESFMGSPIIKRKFWQTPSTTISSLFTPNTNIQNRERNITYKHRLLVKEFHDFLNKEGNLDQGMDNVSLSESDETSLEQLSDELVQVFCFENIDKSSNAQKEDLIKRFLKLGGKNYTCEDLRKDILKIEQEGNSLD